MHIILIILTTLQGGYYNIYWTVVITKSLGTLSFVQNILLKIRNKIRQTLLTLNSKSTSTVLALAAKILKLEQYIED